MSWFLAFAGFAALIVLHEFGHFVVAKAVGMRVERFALFFPPLLFKVRRGETEYGIGAIPLGGYVRISGMSPHEELPPEIAPRAYFRQKPWKRIAVILAGPAMNVVVAFVILWAVYLGHGQVEATQRIDSVQRNSPAAKALRPGDVVVAIDGVRGDPARLRTQISSHRCAGGSRRPGCLAEKPLTITVRRGGTERTFSLRPRYDPGAKRPLLGFGFDQRFLGVSGGEAASLAVTRMWDISKATVSAIARLFVSEKARKQVSGVVGSYEVTRQSFDFDITQAIVVLAIISLSLAIVNLFPFLPLDGGHVFWALAEKVRGRPIPFSVMERAGVIGFMLVVAIFVIGFTNDLDRLRGEGFGVR